MQLEAGHTGLRQQLRNVLKSTTKAVFIVEERTLSVVMREPLLAHHWEVCGYIGGHPVREEATKVSAQILTRKRLTIALPDTKNR